jgi:hypothetical protein
MVNHLAGIMNSRRPGGFPQKEFIRDLLENVRFPLK